MLRVARGSVVRTSSNATLDLPHMISAIQRPKVRTFLCLYFNRLLFIISVASKVFQIIFFHNAFYLFKMYVQMILSKLCNLAVGISNQVFGKAFYSVSILFCHDFIIYVFVFVL